MCWVALQCTLLCFLWCDWRSRFVTIFCVSMQQVISAQQLPKLNKDKCKSIVDPLVRVEIYGVPADNTTKETHYITNNGEHHHTCSTRNHDLLIFRFHRLNNNSYLQGSTPCGTSALSLTSVSQSWPWCSLWWRIMTQRPRMISSGSTVYHSRVYRMVKKSRCWRRGQRE